MIENRAGVKFSTNVMCNWGSGVHLAKTAHQARSLDSECYFDGMENAVCLALYGRHLSVCIASTHGSSLEKFEQSIKCSCLRFVYFVLYCLCV